MRISYNVEQEEVTEISAQVYQCHSAALSLFSSYTNEYQILLS